MRLVSWSVMGLYDLGKCSKIKSLFIDNDIDIILLQETKIENPDYRIFICLRGHCIDHWAYLPANGSADGLMLGWNDNCVILLQSIIKDHSMHLIFSNTFYNDIYV
jgi:hypothetical protein